MKRILICIACLFALTFVSSRAAIIEVAPAGAWGVLGISGGGGGEAPASYPDILFFHSFETSTTCASCTADKAAGSGTMTCGDGVTIDSGFAAVGSNSLDNNSAWNGATVPLSSEDNATIKTSGRVGFWMYITTAANSHVVFLAEYDANNYLKVELLGSNMYISVSGGGTGATYECGTAVSAATWYFVEVRWDKGGAGNDYIMYVSTEISQDTTGVGSEIATGIWAGTTGTIGWNDLEGNGGDTHIDNVMISNDKDRDLYALRNETSLPD